MEVKYVSFEPKTRNILTVVVFQRLINDQGPLIK